MISWLCGKDSDSMVEYGAEIKYFRKEKKEKGTDKRRGHLCRDL